MEKEKKKRERRERKSRTEDGHRYPLFHGEDRLSPYLSRRQPIPKIEFTRSAFESGTCLLNRETFLSAQESGNWLRFRSRSSRHRNPLLSSRGWPSSLDEFRGPTSRPDEKGHEEAGRRGGKFGNYLSAGYPQTVLRVSRGSGINGDNASQLYDRGRFAIFLGIRTACRNFSTSLFFPSRRNVDDSFIVRVASSREIVVVCKSEDRGKLLFSSGSRRERRDRRNGVEAFYIFISLDITIFYRDKFSKMCDE